MSQVIELILINEDLPSPPGVALRLLELYSQPSVEVKEMATVIGTDPVLTAKLIEYCNSPLLARRNETTSVNQAIVVVGMRAVKILALSFSLVRSTPSNNASFDYDQFWNQSLATAVVAQTIGAARGGDGNDEFLLGLMMKIGQVGLAHTFPTKYAELQKQAEETSIAITQLEEQEWDSNHYDVGVELLSHWNFPESIVNGLSDFEASLKHDGSDNEQIHVLKLAQGIVSLLFTPDLIDEDVEKAQSMALTWFGIDRDQFVELFDNANQAWTEFAVLLCFNASQASTFDQLERRARKGIAQLSMGLHTENTAMHQENAVLKTSAMIDALTGLKNRRAYDEEAPAEWERSNRMGHPLAIMMVDIDHFKQVNDTHGHAVGDQALEAVAKGLRSNARQYDTVFRFGGEEFVVMVPDCPPESALIAGERYRKAIEELEIQLEDDTLKITASIGIAVLQHPHSKTLESLLESADKLLYEAKHQGRNRVCCDYDSSQARPLNSATMLDPMASPNIDSPPV